MRTRHVVMVAVILAGTVAAGGFGASGARAAGRAEVLPTGFTDKAVATVPRPVALAPTPDGRILVVDQDGIIRVIKGGALLTAPALDLSAKVCATNSERGMLGIAIDPNFATDGFVYVYYTFKKFPKCKRDIADVPVNRVSRFTMVGDKIKPATEKILIDNMISFHGNHNAGDLGFGKDGLLYVSVGDGGCDYTVGPKACDDLPNGTTKNGMAQKLNTLQGKVLRITASGGIPADNPYTGTGTARCNTGFVASNLKCQEIYLSGLRNPFRFAFDPNAAGTRLFVNDTGEHTWEEIDDATAGANYGWNLREGFCAEGSTTDCGAPPAGMTDPTFAYPHFDPQVGCTGVEGGAITGGAFVPNGLWGAADNGGYLFSDYVCSRIFLIVPNGSGGWTSSVFASGLVAGGPIALRFAPKGATTALYYTTYGGAKGAQVRVITKTS